MSKTVRVELKLPARQVRAGDMIIATHNGPLVPVLSTVLRLGQPDDRVSIRVPEFTLYANPEALIDSVLREEVV